MESNIKDSKEISFEIKCAIKSANENSSKNTTCLMITSSSIQIGLITLSHAKQVNYSLLLWHKVIFHASFQKSDISSSIYSQL